MKQEPFLLGDGALELNLPGTWRIETAGRDSASVRFPTGDYPVLGISLISVEDPQALASGNVATLLRGKETGVAVEGNAVSGWSLAYQAVLDGNEEVRVWRRAAALSPNYLRIVTFALSFPATEEARDMLDTAIEEIGNVSTRVCFSDGVLAIDREASAKACAQAMRLQPETPWEGISLKLPADWKRVPGESERSLVLESTEAPGAFLVLEGNITPLSSTPPDQERAVQLIQAIAEQKGAEDISIMSGAEGEYMLSCHRRDDGNDPPVRERFWNRFLFTNDALIALNATFINPDGDATLSSEISDALADVLGREIKNATLSVS